LEAEMTADELNLSIRIAENTNYLSGIQSIKNV